MVGGKRYKANRGVIMCTGGFENDPEMMFTYTGIQGCVPLAGVANTGDGHRACMKVGADFWHMHGGAQFWMTLRDLENTRFASVKHSFVTKQHGITVGVNGRRFYNGLGQGLWPSTEASVHGAPICACNVGYAPRPSRSSAASWPAPAACPPSGVVRLRRRPGSTRSRSPQTRCWR